MVIDRTHRGWIIAAAAIFFLATAMYVPYAISSPAGPHGGTGWGIAFGVAGFALMIFAGLLSLRKKVPVWRVGRAQTWMRGHLWLGLVSLPLILFHAGFRFGGGLTTVLMWLMIVVIVSGVFGAVLQHYLPRVMTEQVPRETIYDQIERVRIQLRDEAEQIVRKTCSDFGEAVASAPGGPASSAIAAAPAVAAAGIAVEEAARERLLDFYGKEMRPFLERPAARHPLADANQADAIFTQLQILLPRELHAALNDLRDLCEEERQLTRQVQLHRLLHGWLLVHVPLSFALLALGGVHAIMALRY